MDERKIEEKLTLLDELQSACTFCGLCSEACATFQATGWEHESPRGRLQLAGQFLHGNIPPESSALSTFDRCLGCRACESFCPHQVSYHRVRELVQELRRELKPSASSSVEKSDYEKWISLAYRWGSRWWRFYGRRWLLPFSLGSYLKKRPRVKGEHRTLAICCVQDLLQHQAIEQALDFMQRLGYPLIVDRKQPCCGAIFERLVNGGIESIEYPQEQQKASILQNKRLEAFLKWMPTSTYFLSLGCQSFVARHQESVLDLYLWIEEILNQKNLSLVFSEEKVVYYQPYCGQKGKDTKEKDAIWRVLQSVEGLTVKEIFNGQSCCGGFCGEFLLHPEHAKELAWQKISSLPKNATLIVTSPDCWGLFQSFSEGKHLNILYPIQLLAEAFLKVK